MVNYSENFERDYWFYLSNLENFTFCGTLNPKFIPIPDKNGHTAKEVFWSIDSNGKNKPCRQPLTLKKLLLCKASVNFFIKQWAEGRAEGTLPYCEFAGDCGVYEWVKKGKSVELVRFKSIKQLYNLPDWVVKAVERQKHKILQAQFN